MTFGIDRLLAEPALRAPLKGARVALLAHPASVTQELTHSLDALAACGDVRITSAFGPQHGLRGDKQDNMVDLQDLGCRIYTFITTLRYILEAAAKHKKAVWVLDRPNPVGRPVEGLA